MGVIKCDNLGIGNVFDYSTSFVIIYTTQLLNYQCTDDNLLFLTKTNIPIVFLRDDVNIFGAEKDTSADKPQSIQNNIKVKYKRRTLKSSKTLFT